MINLGNALHRNAIQLQLIVAVNEGPLKALVSSTLETRILNKSISLSIMNIARILNKENFDIVISTQKHVDVIVHMAKWISRSSAKHIIRVATNVTMDNSISVNFKRKILNILSKRIYNKCDKIITVSKGVRKDLLENMGLPEDKMINIYTPFITEEFTNKLGDCPQFTFSDDKINIVAMGRVMPVKDFSTLISAFDLVVNKYPESRLYILGNTDRHSDEYNKLKNLIDDLNLNMYVNFLGYINNPYPVLKQGKIFVLSSIYEGMPGSLVQAAACGCMLVSTDCDSGPDEIITNSKYGRLVPVKDPVAMAEAITELLDDPSKVQTPDLTEFTEEYSVKAHMDLFNQLIMDN